jgi:hypothetical protein
VSVVVLSFLRRLAMFVGVVADFAGVPVPPRQQRLDSLRVGVNATLTGKGVSQKALRGTGTSSCLNTLALMQKGT